MKKFNSVADIESWSDIESCIKCFYTDPKNDFIKFYKTRLLIAL